MSDTPTYARLLTQLFSGSPEERANVLSVLEVVSDADRLAVEPEVRARLRDTFPWLRLIAAEAVSRVYKDYGAAADVIRGVLRSGDPAAAADAAAVVRQLGQAAVPLLVLMVRHAPDVFAAQTAEYHRWAAETAVRSGPDGLAAWLELFAASNADAAKALLIGLAGVAPAVAYDLTPAEAALRAKLSVPAISFAVGAALWRITWRVNREWLTTVPPSRNELYFPGLRELILEVLIEHLGRRPNLGGLIRDTLAVFAEPEPERAEEMVGRLSELGSLGWAVLIPMLHPTRSGEPFPVPDGVKAAIFRKAIGCPAALPLVHHHAHGIVVSAAVEGSASVLIPFAVSVLAQLGPVAGMAVPDLLNLVVRVPSTGSDVALALRSLAAGFPNTPAAIARALHRVRTTAYFGADHLAAFQALAAILGELDPDVAPRLVESTGIDARATDLLLQQPAWKDAAPEVRVRHALMLADRLANPRAEVRIRAAESLRHYRAELPEVWPALVAVLAGPDEKVALGVLPHFRFLAPAAEAVTADLGTLFRERNPAYAARAVVALWRLGRMADVAPDLRSAVETATEGGWGWAVLRGVVSRVSQAHGLLADLNSLFAASPAAVADKVAELVNPPESPEDERITRAAVDRLNATAANVDWDTVYNLVGSEGVSGALLYLALMCEYGSTGFRNQKIWLIKHHRELTRVGLAESKLTVERTVSSLERPGATSGERHRAVRDFFAGRVGLPPEIVALLDHRLGWFRWAGLELADSWGLSAEQAKELTEDRVWDTSTRVRERALRMVRG